MVDDFLHIFVIVIIFQLVVLPWVTAFMRVTVKVIDCVHISFRLAEFARTVREGPNHCLGLSFLSRIEITQPPVHFSGSACRSFLFGNEILSAPTRKHQLHMGGFILRDRFLGE